MAATIDLHKLAKATNLLLVLLAVVFLAAGIYLSFWFHFVSVPLLLLTVMNFFYRHVQTRHAVLRNFGLMGQVRYALESLGPELRQYLFASDTEERPFNRDERAEVYRKAKGIDAAVSFGSQMDFDAREIKLRQSIYPTPEADLEPFRVTFGEERGLDTAFTITKPPIISAMSYGALGRNAVRSLARGARIAGIPMNTGEGGYPKHHLAEGCDLIFQMGTAKFGVRHEDGRLDPAKLEALAAQEHVRMIEIKLSQGAKPGKGGLLPKEKITDEIAELRNVPRDRDVISPAGHAECTDDASTVRFIRQVQEVSGLPVGMKMCVGRFEEVRSLLEEMKRQDVFPDYISIDGGEGGTGAAPKPYIDGFGLPLLAGLSGVQQLAVELGVRDRFKMMAAGKLINAGKQVIAMSLGADAVYTARGFMLSIGCIQALQCAHNTCPVGITTHDPHLQHGLVVEDKARRVANYVDGLVHDFDQIVRSLGVRSTKALGPGNLYIPAQSILAEAAKEQA